MAKRLVLISLCFLMGIPLFAQSGTIYFTGYPRVKEIPAAELYQITWDTKTHKPLIKGIALPKSHQWQINTITNHFIGANTNQITKIPVSTPTLEKTITVKLPAIKGKRLHSKLSPSGKYIAFLSAIYEDSTHPDISQLNIISLETFAIQTLISSSAQYYANPIWSPDEKFIYFYSGDTSLLNTPAHSDVPGFSLLRISCDGKTKKTLLPPGKYYTNFGNDPVVPSPDNKTIALSGKYDSKASRGGLYLLNADGTGLRFIKEDGWEAAWDPTGTRLLFTADRNIWLYNKTEDKLTQLTFGSAPISNPTWSPDGQHILYTSNKPIPGIEDYCQGIYLYNINTKEESIVSSGFRTIYSNYVNSIYWVK